jgi:NAD(P)H-hydrate epimerase
MKIFSAAQVRKWDAYTIANEPISAINLMERAATACVNWISHNFTTPNNFTIFCGPGNNGGDGLAIARLLLQTRNKIVVYILAAEKKSPDFIINLERLKEQSAEIKTIDGNNLPEIQDNTIIIDAIFGAGLSRPLENETAYLVAHINHSNRTIISIDIPTGLFADSNTAGASIIKANHTLSFQTYKLAFMMTDTSQYTGIVNILKIGLHADFYSNEPVLFNTVEQDLIKQVYKPRNQFLHKYNFGHALLFAGSKNMMGASILCAEACLRSGAGLATVFTEAHTQAVIHTALPEAITSTESDFEKLIQKKSAIGVGPGLAFNSENTALLKQIISTYLGPVVIDATGLQLLATDIGMLQLRKSAAIILTPHTGEFEKLFGKTQNDFERMETAIKQAVGLNCYIILKGHHTMVACADGTAFFNTTGNAGMATAGSGDTLTGIITGLLAQQYSPKSACLLGVYLHGLAGDYAAKKMSQEAMLASDIIDNLGEAFKKISSL